MIVWLNGPFGVGKSSVARELVRLVPKSRIHDPERLGWLLKRTVGRLRPGDYQQLSLWQHGTISRAHRAGRDGRAVFVPMTVLNPEHLDRLLTGLRTRGDNVLHVVLDAPAAVLAARIAGDKNDPGAEQWRRRHIALYEQVKDELTANAVTLSTAGADPRQLAAQIAAMLEPAL
ncbi:MAG TPA: AAA family ATPase [Jatrophihabitantaceae bacterium]|jgi:predicted kinase|nr:AAA family ATPase [Jatrophihabitantaceae bacterium]